MKSTPIPADLFARNRAKLGDLIMSNSMVVICSNDQMPRNGDQYYPFRQHSDFFYLAGINQEESVLVLSPDHPESSMREILFIHKPATKTELWSGPRLSCEEAMALSGIGQVRWMEELDSFLEKMIRHAAAIFFNHVENAGFQSRITTPDTALHEKITRQYTDLNISRLSPLMIRLRMVKEYEEVEEIRKASAITRSAFLRVLKNLKPGVWEYEVEAEITAEFIRKGAEGNAFEPIVACGTNALILHYTDNKSRCRNGELLLMDFGAEVNNYAADCTRTIPVNGRFSKRQREVYDAVLRVFRQASEMMVPGAKMAEFHNQVGALWEKEHIGLGLYTQKEAADQLPSEPLWKRYFMHGTAHSLGLDVHDPFDRTQPFLSGMVLTCEPAIYIPEEGMGIRLENDILITENGAVDLMEDIPVEAGEIEEIMQSIR
ncbi:MAG: aminopeptidase P N-terminal domain-containing protein [Bacteroidales bacterium]|nr:aminopeptidase P N-terminal domain-containing protein [Bacteroidales bacterium]